MSVPRSHTDRPDHRTFGVVAHDRSVKQLGTAINGAVDSPVNGGVELYREVCQRRVYEEDQCSPAC